MFDFIKKLIAKWFGGSAPAPALPAPKRRTEPGPMGLFLGRSFTMNLEMLSLEAESLSWKEEIDPDMVITGHGVTNLDGGGILHRFYDDDGRILQVVCNGSIDNPTEVMLLLPWDSHTPQTDREWNNWEGPGGKMRARTYDAEGTVFERVFGDPSTPDVPLIEFTETIDADEGPRKRVHQKTMSFKRSLPSGNVENLLIISERDLASDERGSLGFMLGYGLAVGHVKSV